MSHRVIQDLKWARALSARPDYIPLPRRVRGAKARGLAYERRLGEVLPGNSVHGLWFEFEDRNGPGCCQVDYLVPLLPVRVHRRVLVIECKYTWVLQGHKQIEELYKPVIELAWDRQVVGLVACRKLIVGLAGLVSISSNLDSAIAAAEAGRHAVWHNLAA